MKELVCSSWRVRGLRPHAPIGRKSGCSIGKYYVTNAVEATVPGGVHMDLFRAGLIDNPYYDQNSRACEWIESRWWMYETELSIDVNRGNKRYLVFDGLDYGCEVFINDKSMGEHENMFTEMRIDITDIAEETVNLKVVFHEVPNELGQYGATSETFTQKSRFGYGWDFGVRLVNIGIWRPVWIEYINEVRISEAKIYSDYAQPTGTVDAWFALEGETDQQVCITLYDPAGAQVKTQVLPFANEVSAQFAVNNPELWWPNGMGAHPLYTLEICCAGECHTYKIGIRSLRYRQNPGAPADSIPYTIVINDKPVYLKGNNKVPLDHLYGNVGMDEYEWCIKAMVNENVNTVRCWGGGLIETEEFYNLCDQNGIMIWQDFIQSSSGAENVPSSKEIFLKKAKETAIEAVKTRRNHVSLTFWCGGNELTDPEGKPVTCAHKNIGMLAEVVAELDPQRQFLPSTPSGPIYCAEFTAPNNHDVHGPWEYFFDTHYENYNQFQILLNSEFGVSGPAERCSLFLKENDPACEGWNANKHHGEYWWHSFKRDAKLFGEFDGAEEYIPYGQWAQAESLRYTIESERRNAPHVSGSMIWQLNEPWPNSDNTCIVDYFGTPKMAYYWSKSAFSDCPVSLKYNSLSFAGKLSATVCRVGDYTGEALPVAVRIYNAAGQLQEQMDLTTDALPYAFEIALDGTDEMYMVRLTCAGENKEYFFSTSAQTPYAPAKRFAKTRLTYQCETICEADSEMVVTAKVKNEGDVPAYFVRPGDINHAYAVIADDAYFTLLPGEERTVTLKLRKCLGFFFELPQENAEITFACINE